MAIYDLSKIDFRVGDDLTCNKTSKGYNFEINSLFIEDIPRQLPMLSKIEGDLKPNDTIKVDLKFGWYDQRWITFPVNQKVIVVEIIPHSDIAEVMVKIRPIRLHFRK